MINILITILSLTGLLMLPLFSYAKDGCAGDCTSCHTLSENEASGLLKKSGGSIKSIKNAPIAGMYELLVEKDGKEGLVYIDYGKKYLMQGFILNLDGLKPVTAHIQESLQKNQATFLDPKTIPLQNAIVMGNPQGLKKMYVFTDPDSSYCRDFHKVLKKLVQQDTEIALYILLFPLPSHPLAYEKARAILSTKKLETLESAFNDKEIVKSNSRKNKDALDETIKFAVRSGIQAAPSLILSDGRVITGFKDSEELVKLIRNR